MRQIDTNARITRVRLQEQSSNPAAPSSGYWYLFVKNDGLYIKDASGGVTGPFSAGSGGDVATDAIWDAKGDLAVATGADAAIKVAVGANGKILVADSAQAAGVGWKYQLPTEAALVIPTAAGFASTRSGNGGIGTITDISGGWGVRLTSTIPAGNTNSLTYAVDAVSVGANGWRATARLRRHFPLVTWGMAGMIMRDNAGGKSVLYWMGNDTVVGFNRNQFAGDDTWNAVAGIAAWSDLDWWMRIVDDLTNWYCYVSKDGSAWNEIYRETRNTYLGTVPTHVGIAINPNFNGGGSSPGRTGVTLPLLDCLSWQFEQI